MSRRLELAAESIDLSEYSPEKRLLCKMIIRSAVDLEHLAHRADAIKWFRSTASADQYGSFYFCCEQLGMSPEYVRKRLHIRELTNAKNITLGDLISFFGMPQRSRFKARTPRLLSHA